ncbi:MAG: alkaline phosphatase D [Verrucomicrobiales bacterium]|jgi:alkaline phosphatase D
MQLKHVLFVISACGLLHAAEDSRLTHGPMLGQPSSTGMTVWVRSNKPSDASIRYGTDHLLNQTSTVVRTSYAQDLTTRIPLTNLKPGTHYDYEVIIGETPSRVTGSFTTLPSAEQCANPYNPDGLFNVKFEFACGNNQNPFAGLGTTMPTYDTLLRDVMGDIHFAILNGDWLYEENRDYTPEAWITKHQVPDTEIPDIVKNVPTIVGVWENYKTYLGRAPNLATWHRHVPSFFTFDDHELLNDLFGSGTAGYRDRRAIFRDIGVQGWYDYLGWSNPFHTQQGIHFGKAHLKKGDNVLFDSQADFTQIDLAQAANLHVHWGTPDAGVKDIEAGDKVGGDPNANIYNIEKVIDEHHIKISPKPVEDSISSYSIGRHSYGTFKQANCQFFFLDTRTHRQLHDLENREKKGLSMLGLAQRKWLMDEMEKSDAQFFFVVSSVNFMIPHVGGGGHHFDAATKDDAWTAFLDEREILIKHWEKLNKPTFVLTGDLHNSFAVKITDTIWEFASGPHNSVNHRAKEDEANRPINGPFKFGPRPCDIRWSTTGMDDIPRRNRTFPHYCVVKVNNVFNNPIERGGERWIAFPKPHVIFQYYNGLTGELDYAETIHAP